MLAKIAGSFTSSIELRSIHSVQAHLHNFPKAEDDGRVLVLWLALPKDHSVPCQLALWKPDPVPGMPAEDKGEVAQELAKQGEASEVLIWSAFHRGSLRLQAFTNF